MGHLPDIAVELPGKPRLDCAPHDGMLHVGKLHQPHKTALNGFAQGPTRQQPEGNGTTLLDRE